MFIIKNKTKMTQSQMQLGKNGVTENFIQNIEDHFKHHKIVKISVLRSCCRDRIALKELAEHITGRLGPKYNAKIIGYTIIIKKGKKLIK